MNTLDRRHLLTTAAGAGAAILAGRWLQSPAAAADKPPERIKIGQIGTGHERASAKMETFRKDMAEFRGRISSDYRQRQPRLRTVISRSMLKQPGRWM
ncbi:MAG: hypothetical protein HUU20_01795 [Pirellulales bacterium]|nr:hypothetical protein [Pirellulales bacterium]